MISVQRNFFYHPRLLKYSFGNKHPYNSIRLANTIKNISKYGLGCCDFEDASYDDLLSVHTRDYIDSLIKSSANQAPSVCHGIGTVDTPVFPDMYDACRAVAGATKAAAEAICRGDDIAFNMSGGLHHARSDYASGFCAVDDISIGVQMLLNRFDRVAYLDIDLHHGDGVEARFAANPSVLTASVHQFGHGFYPGTGTINDDVFHIYNEPLNPGTDGQTWLKSVNTLVHHIDCFNPGAIVLQCGVDAHDSDPLGSLRVSSKEWMSAVHAVRALNKPMLVLGGGGYDHSNPPRMWSAMILSLSDMNYDLQWLED